jgi:hypothetical protein
MGNVPKYLVDNIGPRGKYYQLYKRFNIITRLNCLMKINELQNNPQIYMYIS